MGPKIEPNGSNEIKLANMALAKYLPNLLAYANFFLEPKVA
jgi:hypothetical protein